MGGGAGDWLLLIANCVLGRSGRLARSGYFLGVFAQGEGVVFVI